MSEFQIPKTQYIEAKKEEAKSQISIVFDEYKALLRDKTHPDNQTNMYDTKVKKTIQRLLNAADKMDSINPGEGIFGLIILSLTSILKLKNENIKLEVKILELEKRIRKMEKTGAR